MMPDAHRGKDNHGSFHCGTQTPHVDPALITPQTGSGYWIAALGSR
jgi:hypothetical protein